MSTCCESAPTRDERPALQVESCRLCGRRGRPVPVHTVQALLSVSLRPVDPAAHYRFCATATCAVVYFAATQQFTVDQVREPVYQKAAVAETAPVCYCFGHSRASILTSLRATGQTTVIEEISAAIREGRCACELRNPQGSCCLGNVRALVKELAFDLSHRE